MVERSETRSGNFQIYDKILECDFALKNVSELPEVVNKTTEYVDEMSDDFIFCCCFDLDIVEHPILKCVNYSEGR